MTGAGIFAESQKLGRDLDWPESGVFGSDSVQNAVHRGKLFWAWGDNTHGVLGDGSTTSQLNPEPLGLTGITQVATSIGWNSAAVRSDGTLWTWGDNSDGELGIGNDSTL